MFRLDGCTAIVTGGMGRLGSQYAQALAGAGARVALFDVVATPNTQVQALVADGVVSTHVVNATKREAVDRAVADVARRFGPPSILVNNAGLGSSPADAVLETGRFERYPESAWDAMLESHLKSALVTSQSFVEQFRQAGLKEGSIINVSSTYGLVAPDQSVYDYRRAGGAEYYKPVGYSVAKSGILNFTRWLAEYCGPFGLRVNTLVPGGVREENHAQAFVDEYEKRTPLRRVDETGAPLGRMAREDDYNGAIVFLASRASAYMTGAMLVIDGGWTAR